MTDEHQPDQPDRESSAGRSGSLGKTLSSETYHREDGSVVLPHGADIEVTDSERGTIPCDWLEILPSGMVRYQSGKYSERFIPVATIESMTTFNDGIEDDP